MILKSEQEFSSESMNAVDEPLNGMNGLIEEVL
jgi:hypothetical protein